jgi:hypothetical protein
VNVSGPPRRHEPRQAFASSGGDQTLVDLLDRVLDRGVVIAGDVVLSVAGVDLVHLELRLRLQGVDAQVTGSAGPDR